MLAAATDPRCAARFCLLELITYIKKHPTPLFIGVDGGDELTALSDADWNNSKFHLSTTGFVVFHGNNPISWASRTQRNTARSVGESEFILELQYLHAGSAQSVHSATAPSATVRANDDAEHAVNIFNGELELNAATMFTHSASSRLLLSRKQTWCENKLRHVGTAFRYVRGPVRHGNITVLPVKGTENCSDTLTKGYDTPLRE